WFDKNRANLFRQQNNSQESFTDGASRSASPPANPILHSPPTANSKDEKARHTSQKEISPVFHQFLDSVYQLQRHYPNAFEFNERFLLRLLYQVYAGQYGEFLFNCERERMEHAGRLPSVWIYFISRRADFINSEYRTEESLMLPKRGGDQQMDVRWWFNLFGQRDEDMNVPRALAPATNIPAFNIQPSSLSLDDCAATGAEEPDALAPGDATLRETKSTPALSSLTTTTARDVVAGVSVLSVQSPITEHAQPATLLLPALQQDNSSAREAPSRPADPAPSTTKPETGLTTSVQPEQSGSEAQISAQTPPTPPPISPQASNAVDTSDFSDPLGVTTTRVSSASARPDFVAFASQNAFRE
ncbi:hypothetical protein B0A55_08230, partial [Friedmanniomyces simplex]